MSKSLLLIASMIALAAVASAVILPDASLTPGATFNVDVATVCKPGYSGTVRHVPASEKTAVYKSYGVAPYQGYCSGSEGCEIDHLISLEIGGSNEQTNLWPQPYQGTWNAHMKDRLEDYFHTHMCSGELSMSDVQAQISTNWINAYKKYIGGGSSKVDMAEANTPEWQRIQAYETMFEQGYDVFAQFHGRVNMAESPFAQEE